MRLRTGPTAARTVDEVQQVPDAPGTVALLSGATRVPGVGRDTRRGVRRLVGVPSNADQRRALSRAVSQDLPSHLPQR